MHTVVVVEQVEITVMSKLCEFGTGQVWWVCVSFCECGLDHTGTQSVIASAFSVGIRQGASHRENGRRLSNKYGLPILSVTHRRQFLSLLSLGKSAAYKSAANNYFEYWLNFIIFFSRNCWFVKSNKKQLI